MTTSNAIPPITEDDIAEYLLRTPGFFERHAEVLAGVQLTSPHGQRAVSLQERQMEMLRDRIKGLERRIIEMIRHGQENEAIAEAFTAAHPDFELLDAGELLEQLKVEGARGLCSGGASGTAYLRLWPHRHQTDGFFAAVWTRKR